MNAETEQKLENWLAEVTEVLSDLPNVNYQTASILRNARIAYFKAKMDARSDKPDKSE